MVFQDIKKIIKRKISLSGKSLVSRCRSSSSPLWWRSTRSCPSGDVSVSFWSTIKHLETESGLTLTRTTATKTSTNFCPPDNHVCMVHKMIGNKAGTGGSSGYYYLRSTVRYFPNDFMRNKKFCVTILPVFWCRIIHVMVVISTHLLNIITRYNAHTSSLSPLVWVKAVNTKAYVKTATLLCEGVNVILSDFTVIVTKCLWICSTSPHSWSLGRGCPNSTPWSISSTTWLSVTTARTIPTAVKIQIRNMLWFSDLFVFADYIK